MGMGGLVIAGGLLCLVFAVLTDGPASASLYVGGATAMGVGLILVAVGRFTRRISDAVGGAPTFQDMNDGLALANAMTQRSMTRDALRARGERIGVTLVEATATGQEWASAPVYEVRVRLPESAGGAEVAVREAVPLPVVPQLRQGMELTALIAPDDPEQLAIEW